MAQYSVVLLYRYDVEAVDENDAYHTALAALKTDIYGNGGPVEIAVTRHD